MDITVKYITRKFDEFNKQMFAGKLPMLPIRLSNAKTFLGVCTYKKRRGKDGRIERYDFALRINVRIDLTEEEVEDTIIHEMIHYYIGYYQIEDTSAHGKIFRQMMNTINERYGRHITISHKASKAQKEQAVYKRQQYHVIALVSFRDGRTGIKVLPRVLTSILKYYNGVTAVREVASVRLYMSNNIFFNKYPNSSTLSVHYIDADEVKQHLIGAEKMVCDGRQIIRNQ